MTGYSKSSQLRVGKVIGVDINSSRTLLRMEVTLKNKWDYRTKTYRDVQARRSTSNFSKMVVVG
jgi:hypothetical protein